MASKKRMCGYMGCKQPERVDCTRCCQVKYCSVDCQKTDWAIHKLTCGENMQVSASNVTICNSGDCTREGTKHCGRCKRVNYCSAECQKRDWKLHKTKCQSQESTGSTMHSEDSSITQTRGSSSNNKEGQPGDSCAIKDCRNEGTKRCSGCKKVAYCSKQCQKNDWAAHKRVCGESTKKAPTYSSTNHNASHDNSRRKDEEEKFMNFFMGKSKSVAQEYLQKYKDEEEHAKRIGREESVYNMSIMSKKLGGPVLTNEDFTAPENFMKRWHSCILDKDHLISFLTTPGRQFGDIYERPNHDKYTPLMFETMRNTSVGEQIYELGQTYMGFGFVDLFQLLWGNYIDKSRKSSNLHFYGFDMNRIVTLRSKLIYGAMKHYEENEVSTSNILQIWFSSCWEQKTKAAFDRLVNDALQCPSKFDLEDSDVVLIKRWSKNDISISKAKKDFSAGMPNAIFDPVWQLKFEQDRVYFCRYILTGIIFADEKDLICGNPTMFTQYEGARKLKEELFFKSIDLNLSSFGSEPNLEGQYLHSIILNLTAKKAARFRNRVFHGQIICHLETKLIEPDDWEFARRIRNLDPYGIDWSNIPDYMEKKAFIKFARACSSEETLHQAHFLNWVQYVYGSVHVDWLSNQERCLEVYHQSKRSMDVVKNIFGQRWWSKFIQGNEYVNSLNDVNTYLSATFKSKFEDYFLSDENGVPLNRAQGLSCDAIMNHFFAHSPTLFRAAFSFNRTLRLTTKTA